MSNYNPAVIKRHQREEQPIIDEMNVGGYVEAMLNHPKFDIHGVLQHNEFEITVNSAFKGLLNMDGSNVDVTKAAAGVCLINRYAQAWVEKEILAGNGLEMFTFPMLNEEYNPEAYCREMNHLLFGE